MEIPKRNLLNIGILHLHFKNDHIDTFYIQIVVFCVKNGELQKKTKKLFLPQLPIRAQLYKPEVLADCSAKGASSTLRGRKDVLTPIVELVHIARRSIQDSHKDSCAAIYW